MTIQQNQTGKNMKLFASLIINVLKGVALPVSLCVSLYAQADNRKDDIINLSVATYGGDKLLKLRNLKYSDKIDHFFSHQSGHAMVGATSQHLNQIKIEAIIDYENQQSELKRLTQLVVGYHENRNLTATHRIFKKGLGYNLDHFLKEFQQSKRINFNNADLGYSQMLDPIIIKKLASSRNNAHWVDTAFIQGEAHDVLTVFPDTDKEYSVYISQSSGLLSRMIEKRGNGTRTYNFLAHEMNAETPWATQLYVANEKGPLYFTNSRKLSTNLTNLSAFETPSDYRESNPVEFFDVSELTIRELSTGVFYVGKDWGYTLFVDAGDHYISAGAWGMSDRSDDWLKALNLLHKTTGNQKPVKWHLVSHHHTDHMSELHDVLDHGAKILTHPQYVKSVREFLKDRKVSDNEFKTIDSTVELADGTVVIFDAPSSQASHNLAIYLPQHKIIFVEDVFGSSFQKQHHSPRSWPHMDTYQRLNRFVKQVNDMGLEVEQYVSSHHGRVLNWEEIKQALKVKLPTDGEIRARLFN